MHLGQRILIGFLCLTCIVWTLTQPSLTQESDSIDTLKQHQQQINQQRSQVQKERDRIQNLERSAQTNLKGIRKNIQATKAQIQVSETKLQTANQQLRKLEIALESTEKSYRTKQVSTISRLQFLQRQQGSHGWAVLLQSRNLNDFLDRRHQLKRIFRTDRKILNDLKADADRLDQQHRQVDQQKTKSPCSPSNFSPKNQNLKHRQPTKNKSSIA